MELAARTRAGVVDYSGAWIGARLVSGLALVFALGACAGASNEGSIGAAQTSDPESTIVVEAEPSDSQFLGRACQRAPRTTELVVLLPPWSSGGIRELEIENRQEAGGEVTVSVGTTSVRLEYSPIAGGGWRFLWEVEPAFLGNSALSQETLDSVVQLLTELPPQRVRYRLQADRLWFGVDNLDELRGDVLTTLDAFLPVLGDAMTAERDFYTEMSDENLGLIYSKGPVLMHSLEGIELIVGEVASYPDELSNPFGGRPIPATTSYEVLDLVDEDGCVLIQRVTRADSEQLAEIQAESLGGEELEGFEVETLVTAQFDWSTGFFHRIESSERVVSSLRERIRSVVIIDVTDQIDE